MAAAIAATAAVLLALAWPFTRAKVTSDLAQATRGTVRISGFHRTFFPPGGVAEEVTFQDDPAAPPRLTVRKMIIQSSLPGLLRHEVSLIRLDGAHMILSTGRKNWPSSFGTSRTKVDRIVAVDTTVEIRSRKAGPPSQIFLVHELTITNPGGQGVMTFAVATYMAKPPAEMRISGRLGPWKSGDANSSAVSADYWLEHADLGAFHGLAGTVTSQGKLEGTLGRLAIAGHVEIPNFEVTSSGHAVPLTAEFHAAINALNGDLALQEVRAHFGATTVLASGDIARHPATQPRTATLQLAVRNGTAQDVLGLFTHGPRPPMSGPASLQARATLSGGDVSFLRKLRMEGDFVVDPGNFTSPHTQQSMDVLSEKARGNKNAQGSERVADDLRGHAVIENGIVSFSRVSFRVPGALAYVHGTYDLRTRQVNLHGTLKMDAQLSQATRGAKSVLLKALSPFLKKNEHGGAEVPFRITGTSAHPVYQANPVKG